VNEEKRGRVSEQSEFPPSPNERQKNSVKKSKGVPFFGSFFGQAKNEQFSFN